MKTFYSIIAALLMLAPYYNCRAQSVTNDGDTIYISDGSQLYINGSFQNLDNGSKNAYMRNEGSLQVTGDLSKSPNMIYTGNDTFLVSGSGLQNIAGLPFWYFAVTGGGASTFTGNASVYKSITINNGTLNTGVYALTLDSQASVIENENSYITGKVQVTKYLAKGANNTFGGLGIEINAGNFNPGITTIIRTTGSHLTGNSYSSINRYFDISPSSNGMSGSTVIFHYFDHELNFIAETDLAAYRHRTNGKWEYNGYSSRNSSSNIITASADTLGKFTLGSILHPLPVELLDFQAQLLCRQSAVLSWQTASEENNDHFDLQRSEDGYKFLKIGEVQGRGTTNIPQEYHYIDQIGVPGAPILYYRLKQVDYNGNFTYSEIRKLELSERQQETLKAWYNASENKIEALMYNYSSVKASIRIIDVQGKLITSKEIDLPEGASHIALDVNAMAAGIYSVSITGQQGIQVCRVLKY